MAVAAAWLGPVPISTDIVASYRRPQAVVASKLAAGRREDRVLAYLIGACALNFVAQWPLLSRQAFENPEIALDARLGGALLGWIMIAPLMFYMIAAVVHVVARIFRGKGTWYSARLGLFWSLLAMTPVMLLQGLTAGFIGPGVELNIVSGIVVLAFLWIWGNALIVTEGKDAEGV